MERLSDLRTTIADLDLAKETFGRIAIFEKALAVKRARFEKRVAELTAALDLEMLPERDQLDVLKTELSNFILSQREIFKSPRKIKTVCGSFGLETVKSVEITDHNKLFDTLFKRGYDDSFKTVYTPLKPAIKQRLDAGERIPGCKLSSGDTVVIKVNKAFLKEDNSCVDK